MVFERFYANFVALSCIILTLKSNTILCATDDHKQEYKGRYTRDISEYKTIIPRKVNYDGTFVSYKLPHFYELSKIREKRDKPLGSAHVHYILPVDGNEHHLELWPNTVFMSPNLVVERRRRNISNAEINSIRSHQCHYKGRIRGSDASRAAISVCEGLSGYLNIGDNYYFIEPVEALEPNEDGQHLHLLYENDKTKNYREGRSTCGTNQYWREAWEDRFRWELEMNPNFKSNFNVPKRSVIVPRYIETGVIVDKKFLEYHKEHDIENYVLTIMNIVSNYYHDYSVGLSLDVVVVRIMYLDKEEEEMDLTINPDASNTLASFCKWQMGINPAEVSHPNHHDIAILLTRYDICSDNLTNCNLLGLAYLATACLENKACGITEDSGLMLGLIVTHEMGHVMGCSHDEAEIGCGPTAEDGTTYVMAAYAKPRTFKWSNCSKKFLATFVDNLGECLLDEPPDTSFKEINMPPGAMYDADYQCKEAFGVSEVCPGTLAKSCEQLFCKVADTYCGSKGGPAADGTKCGENKWCYNEKCVKAGERPSAVDGGWGEWSPWQECSRTCGGGVQASERLCDNPKPQNKGRFCLGDYKKYRTCNTKACDRHAPKYRDVQCGDHSNKDTYGGRNHTWKAFLFPDNMCALYCVNENNVAAKLEERVKDGTPCKPGSKDLCIAGKCMQVGCDWVLGSDAVDDICGVCEGDGTQCSLIEDTFDQAQGTGYVKITTIPVDSHNIKVEEVKPSVNTIAVAAKDEKKYFLNGDYSEARDGEISFGDILGIYSHPEPEKEELVIKGPTTEDLVLFICYFGEKNPGVKYRYFIRSANGTYKPQYDWEFIKWGSCSVRCGGGTQISKPSCIEKVAGVVSSSFCSSSTKPESKTRVCNQKKCKNRWHVGEWGPCSGCIFHSGQQHRKVDCVRQNPRADSDDIICEDSECKGPKPNETQLCNSKTPCSSERPARLAHDLKNEEYFPVEKVIGERSSVMNEKGMPDNVEESLHLKKNSGNDKLSSKDCKSRPILDNVPPDEMEVIQVPLVESSCNKTLSEEAEEQVDEDVSESLDTSKMKVFKGEQAVQITADIKKEKKKEEECPEQKT